MSAHSGSRLIAGRYRLGRVIGVGGMGVVYEAEQVPLRRTVALKMLPRERVGSEDAVERLIREAQALSRIDHPGVVRVIDAGRGGDGQAFLAMEYLDGCTLRQLLARHGPLPWRWVLSATRQCLEALAVVHRAGFVHRDIKPSNCFCCSIEALDDAPIGSRPPAIKLIDFGIARAERSKRARDALPSEPVQARPAEGAPIGTPAYWAPEQAATGETSRRSDLYSVGAMLYELLTGELPGSGGGGLEPPSAVNPGLGIPPDLDAIVLKALSADPDARYQSAEALHAALLEIDGDRSQGSTWPGEVTAAPQSSARARSMSAMLGTPSGEGIQLQRLRSKVQQFWIEGVLKASLVASIPSPPRTLEQGLVAGLGEQLEAPPPVEVAETQSTAEIFERNGRSLLIVGAAGSGKTTQLLLVARQLLESTGDEVPVVLTLSQWKADPPDLTEWLASELRAKYQVPTGMSLAWLRRGLILPLLDGLDEVPVKHRAAAVRAINAALDEGSLPGLVVTTRNEEYLDLTERLGLSVALRLHPLRAATVDELSEALLQNSGVDREQWGMLRPLLYSPLAVSLLASTLGSGPVPFASEPSIPPQLADLLEVYTDQMIKRSGKSRLPDQPAKFLEFLEQLAHAMRTNDTDIFVPDGVQPSWLSLASSTRAYALLSRGAAASVYAASLIASFGYTPLNNAGLRTGLEFGLVLAAATALTTGGVHGAYTAQRLTAKQPSAIGTARHWLRVALLGLLSGALNAALVGAWTRHPMGAVLALEVGVLASPLLCPHRDIGLARADIRLIDRLRFSFTKALRSSIFGVGAGFIAAIVVAEDATAMMIVVLYLTSLWFLFGGLRGRQVSTGARPYAGAIHSLRWSLALGGLAILLTALPTAMTYGARYGFYAGLTTGAALWLWYGGMALIQHAVLHAMLVLQGARYFRVQCLEAAADRALLHRLGNGYLFVHPMLRESLARRWEQRAVEQGTMAQTSEAP